MESLQLVLDICSLLKNLIKEAERFNDYPRTIVIHAYLRVFARSYGSHNLETIECPEFNDQFFKIYEELVPEYMFKNTKAEERWEELIQLLIQNPNAYKLTAEEILSEFFEATLISNFKYIFMKNCDDYIYKDIQQKFNIASLEETRTLVDRFASANPEFRLNKWASPKTYDALRLFILATNDL